MGDGEFAAVPAARAGSRDDPRHGSTSVEVAGRTSSSPAAGSMTPESTSPASSCDSPTESRCTTTPTRASRCSSPKRPSRCPGRRFWSTRRVTRSQHTVRSQALTRALRRSCVPRTRSGSSTKPSGPPVSLRNAERTVASSPQVASRSWQTMALSPDGNRRRQAFRSIATRFVARSAARCTPTLKGWSAGQCRRSRSATNASSSARRSWPRSAAARPKLPSLGQVTRGCGASHRQR